MPAIRAGLDASAASVGLPGRRDFAALLSLIIIQSVALRSSGLTLAVHRAGSPTLFAARWQR